VFDIGQQTAVRGAFRLAGYVGDLYTLPVDSEDERFFVLDDRDYAHLQDVRVLEQVLQQLLGRKVAVLPSRPDFPQTVPFEQ
jgi:hypothetical protein